MKRVLAIFIVVTAVQLVFYFSPLANMIDRSSRLFGLVRYLLLPGYSLFLFVPVSPEILGRHPSLVIFPKLVNAYFYSICFAVIWMVERKMRETYS